MAKRELITREEAIKTVSRWIKADMTLGSSLFEMMMNEIPTITEHEIVTPYFEKLKAEIGKSKTEHEMQIAARDTKAKLLISHIYCDIVNILDKCKTESEG